jgi:hypothetical protein
LDSNGVEGTAYNNFNNVYIHQGDSLITPGCIPGLGDVASVNETVITSDMAIDQGVNGSSIGNNVVNIATEPGEFVTVGGFTDINENSDSSANNTINLGGANPANTATSPTGDDADFWTGYLDVSTGAGGGALVTVLNTYVANGAREAAYNIVGGGTGNNVTIDTYSFTVGLVTADPAAFVITIV